MLVESEVCKHVKFDNWHTFTKMPKHIVKLAGQIKTSALKLIIHSGEKEPISILKKSRGYVSVLNAIIENYKSTYNEYFRDFIELFSKESEKDTYDKIRHDENAENAWATKNKLLWDSNIEKLTRVQCSAIIAIYNEHYSKNTKKRIKVIEQTHAIVKKCTRIYAILISTIVVSFEERFLIIKC